MSTNPVPACWGVPKGSLQAGTGLVDKIGSQEGPRRLPEGTPKRGQKGSWEGPRAPKPLIPGLVAGIHVSTPFEGLGPQNRPFWGPRGPIDPQIDCIGHIQPFEGLRGLWGPGDPKRACFGVPGLQKGSKRGSQPLNLESVALGPWDPPRPLLTPFGCIGSFDHMRSESLFGTLSAYVPFVVHNGD